MNSEIVTAVTEWDTVPVGTGYAGLHDLADAEFSGAVTAGDAWGFMLNGRLVGIRDGSLGSFDAAAQTAYEAPTPALPLLYAMQTQDNEKQAEYYTNETAIAEADSTLAGGNFTGYIELSENVLSGDYYIVYYGGRSMSVAFVGNSRQLLTDEEAFDRANDEVGIYDVYAADIDVIDLPEREPTAATPNEQETDTRDTNDGASTTTDTSPPTTTDTDPAAGGHRRGAIDIPQAGPADDTAAGDETATDDADAEPTTTADTSEDETEPTTAADTDDKKSANAEPSGLTGGIDPTGATAANDDSHEVDQSTVDSNGSTVDAGGAADSTSTADTGSTATPTPADTEAAGTTTTDPEPFEEEAAWRNTTTIPSLDPSDDTADNGSGTRADSAEHSGGGGQQTVTRSDDRVSRKQLQQRLRKAEEVMEKAEQKHRQLAAERDDAREELAVAEDRIDELEADLAAAKERIEELEAEPDAAVSAGGTDAVDSTSTTPSHTMDPASALAGTNLFVRYDSKGEATLADAHDGEASKEDVAANIRLDTHTTFETEELEVDGTPFETFLADRIEVAFAEWLVTDLLFELRATGGTTALSAVADMIPAIDRAELRGTIELGTDEDDEVVEREFDCVVRDKRGKPLCVANFDSAKEPVGAELVEGLIRDGNALRERNDSFAASFAVTSSYFTEDAYEMADDATGSGLFSRSGGKSFVNISRKQGFHLCLVDRIKGGFELQKPEL